MPTDLVRAAVALHFPNIARIDHPIVVVLLWTDAGRVQNDEDQIDAGEHYLSRSL